MSRTLLLLILALAGCSRDEPEARPPEGNQAAAPVASRPVDAPAAPASAPAAKEEGEDAIAVLRRYYDHIEAHRYREAWAMRSRSDEGLERFAANFAAYDRYQVTLGHPTEPVEAGGWRYVEVPIQILGTLKGGKGFGSVGSITMRRATAATAGGDRARGWQIYTG
jgi:hypothetical protein